VGVALCCLSKTDFTRGKRVREKIGRCAPPAASGVGRLLGDRSVPGLLVSAEALACAGTASVPMR